jgi:hypothetical protein
MGWLAAKVGLLKADHSDGKRPEFEGQGRGLIDNQMNAMIAYAKYWLYCN